MNIIELAKQAGIEDAHFHAPHPGVIKQLQRFAALVTAHEREACAKIAEIAEPYQAADLIRERNNT